MVTVILVAYLVTSLIIPVVWDHRHPARPVRRQASQTGSMRVRGTSR